MINTVLEWLEQTSMSVVIRKSVWLYPTLEIVHITGIVLLVGPALMFDLRLLGCSRKIAVSGLAKHLLPWSRRSLLLVIPSGVLLFITNATTLGYDPTFWIKIAMLMVAGINALVFHSVTLKQGSQWNENTATPAAAKVTAGISIISWIIIIACGRLLAY